MAIRGGAPMPSSETAKSLCAGAGCSPLRTSARISASCIPWARTTRARSRLRIFAAFPEGVQKIERLAQLDHLSSELLDPEYQPVEQLLRDPMILLPVFDGEPHRAPAADTRGGVLAESSPLQLSEKSQRALVEYVRQGGTLVVFPKCPPSDALAELWKDAPAASAEPTAVISATWGFGAGRVIESSKDFFSWINLKQSFAENGAPGNLHVGPQSAKRNDDAGRNPSGRAIS